MLGLATIGQAPREDIVGSMLGCPDSGTVIQAGALDHLERSAIEGLAPRRDEHPLVTRLTDGKEVVISKERVTPLLNDAVRRLEGAGAALICVLCTGQFQGLVSTQLIVYPDAVLAGVVDAVLPKGALGVVIPHAGQWETMIGKWKRGNRTVDLQVVSPYDGSRSFDEAGERLVSAGADLIVMDCMGYTNEMQSKVRSAVDVPVLLANGVVGGVLASMIPGLISRL